MESHLYTSESLENIYRLQIYIYKYMSFCGISKYKSKLGGLIMLRNIKHLDCVHRILCSLSLFKVYTIILMVGIGSLMVITLKWADVISSRNKIGYVVPFSHPFLQTEFMFVGELICLIPFWFQHFWTKSVKSDEEEDTSTSGS